MSGDGVYRGALNSDVRSAHVQRNTFDKWSVRRDAYADAQKQKKTSPRRCRGDAVSQYRKGNGNMQASRENTKGASRR